jgi:beta-glucosidase
LTDEKKYVSRYIDEENTPQFPFGYGLSYTTFQYGATEIDNKQLRISTLKNDLNKKSAVALTASADVTNTGSRPAEEVVQLYIRLQGTSTAQPVRALKAFQRVPLAPGEKRKVTFKLSPDSLALWDIQSQFTVEPAKVTVWVSPDSASGTAANLEIVP